MKRYFGILVILGVCFFVTSCGIKPDSMEPPPGAEGKQYPHTYPDIANDPSPYSH